MCYETDLVYFGDAVGCILYLYLDIYWVSVDADPCLQIMYRMRIRIDLYTLATFSK